LIKDLERLALLNLDKKKASRKRKSKEEEDPLVQKFRSNMRKSQELQRLFNTLYSRTSQPRSAFM